MIKVSVFYPSEQGSKFDIDYYCDSHMPMVQRKLGSACKRYAIDRGLAGGTPGSKPQFAAIGHLYFDWSRVSSRRSGRTPKRSWRTFPTTPMCRPSSRSATSEFPDN